MKPPFSHIDGRVIFAVMFLAVFVGGANAGDCTRSQSAKPPAAKGHHSGALAKVLIVRLGNFDQFRLRK